ncbi:hypothetical protein GCM10007857_51770 [Bradyrhizobium iriomotense]|uniref:Uncharacterized protein n=1 Tax=Bradyrhizobium iriomotense TaxID=441950 RepID=A0ABQ6B6C4_9BRAD|nr:hypothetical protein GCM10007857_51770 [Bradyrhizobium iriomotense]
MGGRVRRFFGALAAATRSPQKLRIPKIGNLNYQSDYLTAPQLSWYASEVRDPAPARLRFRCAPATPDMLRPSV